MRIPDNARRVNHYSIVFDVTPQELQISNIRKENKQMKDRMKRLEDLLLKLTEK